MLTFVKFGGSLITDKQVESSFRQSVASRLAAEIAQALARDSDLHLLVGHGSGSFGHFAAKEFRTIQGVQTSDEWRAFARVSVVAAELNYLVAKAFQEVGLPVWRIQPSASAVSHDGNMVSMALEPVRRALEHNLVPLVYGDVSIDDVRGGTIVSTETIFSYLAQQLPVKRILLLGEVEGVLDMGGRLIPEITDQNFDRVEAGLGASSGVDVTGGMETKVRDMLALARRVPGLIIRIMDGRQPALLERTLLGYAQPGTLIRSTLS
jgi:isopentenyl phosphate kinase